MLQNFFGGNLENLDFSLKWINKKGYLKSNSDRLNCVHIFVQFQTSDQTFFNFLIWGKSVVHAL